jgi:hypothetical protein
LNELLHHWRVASSHKDIDPKTEDGKEIYREHDTSEPNITGENLDRTVQKPADYEDPSQSYSSRAWLELEKYQAGNMKEQRPFELIGQVGADTRLDSGPWIAAISSATDAPHGRSPGDGE